jgi:pyrimidine-nucleoside phosphorylase
MKPARLRADVRAATGGFVQSVDAMGVALAALRLGAGRVKAEDAVDHAVGLAGLVKIGERVEAGGVLAVVHANDEAKLSEAREMMESAILIGERRAGPPLIAELVG